MLLKVLKENITPNNIGEIMLSQIPAGCKRIISYYKHFHCIVNLIADLQEKGKVVYMK